MNFIDKLEKKLGWIAIPNLTYYLIAGQVIGFILVSISPKSAELLSFNGAQILKGEWWRAITYLMEPLTTNVLFLAFAMYLYYLYGLVLERHWGTFRYTVFTLISIISTLIFSMVFPFVTITNSHLYTTLFLAFAFLFPDFTLMIFFILPLKIKWLTGITWILTGLTLVTGTVEMKILTIVALSNFFIFFGEDVSINIKHLFKHQSEDVRSKVIKGKPNHICATCNKNERDNPDMGIRYCDECVPTTCYCEEHIEDHVHKILRK